MIMVSRLLFGMSKQGVLPLWLSRLLPGATHALGSHRPYHRAVRHLDHHRDLGVLADNDGHAAAVGLRRGR
jgi:hypothetical protein